MFSLRFSDVHVKTHERRTFRDCQSVPVRSRFTCQSPGSSASSAATTGRCGEVCPQDGLLHPQLERYVLDLSAEERPGPYERLRAKITEMMSHVPLRTRITALVMIAVGLSVALASIAALVTVRNQILSQMDNSLYQKAERATDLVNSHVAVGLLDPTVYVVFQGDGTPTGPSNLPCRWCRTTSSSRTPTCRWPRPPPATTTRRWSSTASTTGRSAC